MTTGGGLTPSAPPPPRSSLLRASGYFLGHIVPADGSAGGAFGVGPSTPTAAHAAPFPLGDSSEGVVAAISAAKVYSDPSPPHRGYNWPPTGAPTAPPPPRSHHHAHEHTSEAPPTPPPFSKTGVWWPYEDRLVGQKRMGCFMPDEVGPKS